MIEPFHLKNTEPHTKEINIAALVYLTCFKLAERLMHCKLDSFVNRIFGSVFVEQF